MTASDHATPYRHPCGQIFDGATTHPYSCPACVLAMARESESDWQSRALAAESERDALKAEVERLREALQQARDWFAEYGASHLAKGDSEKANRNLGRAHFCEHHRNPKVKP